MTRLAIVSPCYNEEAVLDSSVARLTQLLDMLVSLGDVSAESMIVFVNDGSTDATWQLICRHQRENHYVRGINLARNVGHQSAIMAGMLTARHWADVVITIDADLQDPPELIPQMIELWEQGYDDVYARRRSRSGETWLKKKTAAWYYRLLQSTTHIPVQIDTGDFRLLSKRCVTAITQLRESQRNTKAIFSWVGYKKKEILYDRDPRAAGTIKQSPRTLINLAIDGITSFTTAPLRISAVLGFLIAFLASIYILYLLIRPLFGVPTGAGYSSLMAVILFLGGVQLLSLGVIGEYIARIFSETKQRPPYLVEEHREARHRK